MPDEPTNRAMEWLTERRLGVIATIGRDGLPRAVPVEIVVQEGAVYVWCHRTSVKARNVERTGSATIVSYKGDDWVMVRGKALVFGAEDPRYDEIARTFLTKYERTDDWGNDALIEISPGAIGTRLP